MSVLQWTPHWAQLQRAADALEGDGLSPMATATASFVILFREGLEALLIVAALLAFTRKANAPRATHYIHLGLDRRAGRRRRHLVRGRHADFHSAAPRAN